MRHLWFTERVIDIVANELGLDPVEVRKNNYVRAEEMPYETPNGCVYDSGDYARCLDIALELVDYDGIEERRRDAESRGKLLGVGIGSTLDSGTNNPGQSKRSTRSSSSPGTTRWRASSWTSSGRSSSRSPRRRRAGHETTAAQVVADIIGCTPDDVTVRAATTPTGTTCRLLGTYASQFAVTGSAR